MKGRRISRNFFLALAAVAVGAMALIGAQRGPARSSQLTQPRISPHDTISRVIDRTNRVMIVYGRPFTKDPSSGEMRKIWGGLVPYGKVWRLGADEATLLITQQPILIRGTEIPAGAHTLFMLPEEAGASKLIINNQIGQWGLQYDEKHDLARVDLAKETAATPVDQLTMAIESNSSGGGVIKITWESTQFSVPFTTKK